MPIAERSQCLLSRPSFSHESRSLGLLAHLTLAFRTSFC